MDKINITLSNKFKSNIQTIIIPILLSRIRIRHLYDELHNYIPIKDKYKNIINHIENNVKNHKLSGASITVELGPQNKLYQIYIVIIRDNKYNNLCISSNKLKNHISNSKTKKQQYTKLKNTKNTIVHGKRKSKSLNNIDNKLNTRIDAQYDLLENARIAGNSIFQTMKTNLITSTNIIDTVCESIFIISIIEGLLLSTYKFLKYKTDKAITFDNFTIDNIHISSKLCINIPTSIIQHKITTLNNLKTEVQSVFLARDLINEPANNNKTLTFIQIINNYIKNNNILIEMDILDKKDIQKLGMGLILGVGQGSTDDNAPKVLILKYNGNKNNLKNIKRQSGDNISGGSHENPDYILLGKGITFDTGGLDLKSGKSMIEMKTDLSGAATVISFLLGYARMNGSKTIYTICPFAENSIGSKAIKPSDVLTAYNGKTVEITNTDAEGRLVLADCLAYAVDKYPNAKLIDFATLTGQQESMSGKLFSCILSVNSNNEVKKLIEHGKKMNEMLVELPIMEKQIHKLESYVADIKNVSFTSSADIIMSSLFMRQFINKNTQWIHIDIAGPSYKLNDVIKYASPEASGIGVRLLLSYFDTLSD